MEELRSQSLRLYCSDFIHHYYLLLKENPLELSRFFGENSSFVFGDLANNIGDGEVCGSQQILEKLKKLQFVNCHVNIRKVDSHEVTMNGNLIVVQVIGELSRSGESMRNFLQTFVLSYDPSLTLDYYLIHNNIFRYLDEVFYNTKVNKVEDLNMGSWTSKEEINQTNEEVAIIENKGAREDLPKNVATKRKLREESLVYSSKVSKVSSYFKNELEKENSILLKDNLNSLDDNTREVTAKEKIVDSTREVTAKEKIVDSNENVRNKRKNMPTPKLILSSNASQTPVNTSWKASKVKYWQIETVTSKMVMVQCPSPKCSIKFRLYNASKHMNRIHPPPVPLNIEPHYCPVCQVEVNIANLAKHGCFSVLETDVKCAKLLKM